MGAFCVYGMTASMAKKAAEAASVTWKTRLAPHERAQLSESDLQAWIEAKAEELLKTGNARQVSGTFDAPQFAVEWIELAKETIRARGLKVMARGEKKDKHGAPIIGKRTKKPVIGWVPYQSKHAHSGPALDSRDPTL